MKITIFSQKKEKSLLGSVTLLCANGQQGRGFHHNLVDLVICRLYITTDKDEFSLYQFLDPIPVLWIRRKIAHHKPNNCA